MNERSAAHLAAACLRSEAHFGRREAAKDGRSAGLSPEGVALADAFSDADGTTAEEVATMVADDPGRAWPVIVAAVEAAPDDVLLAAIAAGLLEDFIVEHGEGWADSIERQAVASTAFGRALSEVWLDDRPELAERLRRFVREPHLPGFAEYHWNGGAL